MDEALRKWILDNYAAGYTPEQLRASLVQSGQDPRMVDQVLGLAPTTSLAPPPVKPKKKGINWTIVLAIVIIGLFIAALLWFNSIIGKLSSTVPGLMP